ncbi:hypothetical protein BVC71_06800 [Marivivens niveibacter]|uniref:Uncharacterized protein n=1 Tax=Marivivens niveibacter TaxID=1930667 RepID=A0A251X048_9RHOB|nr:hypothetical protein BVC71_06800 [Marivivens niveibacter]
MFCIPENASVSSIDGVFAPKAAVTQDKWRQVGASIRKMMHEGHTTFSQALWMTQVAEWPISAQNPNFQR